MFYIKIIILNFSKKKTIIKSAKLSIYKVI